jgi:transcriptional regulator with PAS, ATPase and Fis domain
MTELQATLDELRRQWRLSGKRNTDEYITKAQIIQAQAREANDESTSTETVGVDGEVGVGEESCGIEAEV